MAARTGTNRLPPEAFAAFTFDPTNSSADSAETDSPEVTLREDHDHDQDHLPQDTDHETLLHELAELGCTEITLGILANNQINRQLWLIILRSTDADSILRDELKIESGISRAQIKDAYHFITITPTTTNNSTVSPYDGKTRTKYLDIPKIPSADSGKTLCNRGAYLEHRLSIIGYLELVPAPQLMELASYFLKHPKIFKECHLTIRLTEAKEVRTDAEWANYILTNATRSMARLLTRDIDITWHSRRSGLAMMCTLGAIIMARSPNQSLDGLKAFLAWPALQDVSGLREEMVTYSTALDDLADEGHNITDELQSCALDAMTILIRAQPKHILDLGLWWAQTSRTADPSDKLIDQIVAIETTIHDYANSENTVASSFALREAPKDKRDPFKNGDGSQKICFGMREHGVCKRLQDGKKCGFFHMDFSKCTECVDTEYLATSKCPLFWTCKSKHSKDRKSKAMKPGNVSGQMLRSVDSFQFGSPEIVGDTSSDTDTLSDADDVACEPLPARTFLPDRIGRGIRAAQYLDETDYDDMMLADVPEHERDAALVGSTSDADIRGSSGSHTDASRDSTYDGTSENGTSSDDQLLAEQLDGLALSSTDEDTDGSARDATASIDGPVTLDDLTCKIRNLTLSTAPEPSATKINIADIDDLGPILFEDRSPADSDDGAADLIEPNSGKDFFVDSSQKLPRAEDFPEIDLGENEVAECTGRHEARSTSPGSMGVADILHKIDLIVDGTECSPNDKADRTVHFSAVMPDSQPTVYESLPTSELADKVYWAFSSIPPTEPVQYGKNADWWEAADYIVPSMSHGSHLATVRGELALSTDETVHTYLCTDFSDDQLCPVWDSALSLSPVSGQTLIDSGASRHSLGRLGMRYAQNVRKISPIIMNTANGQVTLSLVADVVLGDGTVVRDWLLNKWSETNLLSEGLANADESTDGIKIESSGNSEPKVITTANTRTSALRIGVLDFLPRELDIVPTFPTSEFSEHLSTFSSQGIPQFPVTFSAVPEFLEIPDDHFETADPATFPSSDLLNQYSDIICCYGLEDESIARHEKAGHYPKMKGCSVCERAFAQRWGARKGGLYKKSRSETMNIDLIDWGQPDFMGLRYTSGGAMAGTCFPVTRCTANKRGPTISDAVQEMIHEVERLSDPNNIDGYNVERLHSDQGSEFKSQLKLSCKVNRVEQTLGEPGHHTDGAVIENFNKMLEYCCTALALTGLETAQQALDIMSELVSHTTKLIRIRSITPFQKQAGISCWQEQTLTLPDISILTKAAVLSLAYGFIPKEQRENKLAARAYMAILVGYDDVVKGAVRLVPFKVNADGTVKFYPTKVTRSYKVFDRLYPLKGIEITYPALPSKCTWIEGDELAATMTDGDLIVGPSKAIPSSFTVERILDHSRYGDKASEIEYQCRYEGYDSTHDRYHKLSDLQKCKTLIDDYWAQQKDDSERHARVVSLAFASDAAAVENAISTHNDAAGAADAEDAAYADCDVCANCLERHPPLCPDELCVGCCEMGGYECMNADAAAEAVAGCTPLWEVDPATLTADQRSDLATLEEDYYDEPTESSGSTVPWPPSSGSGSGSDDSMPSLHDDTTQLDDAELARLHCTAGHHKPRLVAVDLKPVIRSALLDSGAAQLDMALRLQAYESTVGDPSKLVIYSDADHMPSYGSTHYSRAFTPDLTVAHSSLANYDGTAAEDGEPVPFFPPVDNSRAFDCKGRTCKCKGTTCDSDCSIPSLVDDDTDTPSDSDSDSDAGVTKVVDGTKGAHSQGAVVLPPTLCGIADFTGEAAPIISRSNPVMGLGSEHQAKIAFALLNNCDPTQVTINTLHRNGLKNYRKLFTMLTADSPYPEQKWVEAVMAQRSPAPPLNFVPLEYTATPYQTVSRFDWTSLDLPEPQIEISHHFETKDFPDNWQELSKLGNAEPTSVQSYACTDSNTTAAHARANRTSSVSHRAVPTGDEKRGEFSVEEACSEANLERFTKGLNRELGEMEKRRFMPDGERVITEDDMLNALACRLVITEKEDGSMKVRLVAKDLKCKRFVDTADSYAGVPAIKVVRMLLAARAGDLVSSADLVTSYLQADNFDNGESLLLKFWNPLLKEWVYKWSRGYIYGCITAGAAWQKTYREWMLSIGFVECQNATSIYHHKERDMIVSCFVDDPIMFAKTAEDETWYHAALDSRFDVKHHSFLTEDEPLTYCGTRISRDAAGQVCMDNVAFIEKMLLEWGLTECNPVRVPVTKGTMTRLDEAMKAELFYGKEEATEFRSLLGMLHWLAATTMPKLAVAHSLLAKYTATPVEGCMEALKTAARFAAGCQDECLLFGTGDAVGLKLYTDSDWAGLHSATGEVDSRSGGLITLGDYPVDWWSQKQKSIATSSADAESRALGTGVSRGLELQYVADELGISTPTRLNAYTDATAAIGFAKNNGGATRMRHIDVREGWVQQIRNRKNLSIHKIWGIDNPADFFTKIMAKTEFARTSAKLNGTLQLKQLPKYLQKKTASI